MKRRSLAVALALALGLLATGCVHMVIARDPMRVETFASACPNVDTMVVLLPGAYDRAPDFVAQGFVDALANRGIAVDVALADAGIPYYRNRTIVDRIESDVLAPARARGIRRFWFAGISLGGLGSLIMANTRPADVDGVLLIAPFVGDRPVIAEVAAAGGLAGWSPPLPIAANDNDRRTWQWLKNMTREGRQEIYLGYGTEDRLAPGHRLLAAALPADRVFTVPGGHDWPPWRALWSTMVDAAPLPRDPSCAGPRR